MSIREDLEEVEKKIHTIEHESFAMEMLKDQRKQNKRLFIIILVILGMWFLTIGYLVYILNDIGSIIDTIDIDNVSQIDNSTIKNGDDLWVE